MSLAEREQNEALDELERLGLERLRAAEDIIRLQERQSFNGEWESARTKYEDAKRALSNFDKAHRLDAGAVKNIISAARHPDRDGFDRAIQDYRQELFMQHRHLAKRSA